MHFYFITKTWNSAKFVHQGPKWNSVLCALFEGFAKNEGLTDRSYSSLDSFYLETTLRIAITFLTDAEIGAVRIFFWCAYKFYLYI